ncbi:MAG: TonB family protein [Myxococcota bacterium]|nr:TonB family protein [Myxococcota bacterium]
MLDPQLEGRIGTRGTVRSLTDLSVGLKGSLRLDDDARGRLVLGELTLLFALEATRTATARAPLPASARGGLFTQIDARFTAFVVASFTAFFGLAIVLESSDFPVAHESIATEHLARLVFAEPSPPPEPDERDDVSDDVRVSDARDTPQTVTQTRNGSRDARPSAAPSAAPSADDRARIAEEASLAVQMMLGAQGLNGAVHDVLRGGVPTADAAQILGDASGVVPATASASVLRPGDGGGDGSGEDDLGAIARRRVAALEPAPIATERTISDVRIERFEPIGGGGDFDAAVVARAMRARLSAFRRCYEQALRHEPTLAGRWTIELTITERGEASEVSIAERSTHSDALERCVVEAVRRLRVNPAPVGGDVHLAYPLVFAPQG